MSDTKKAILLERARLKALREVFAPAIIECVLSHMTEGERVLLRGAVYVGREEAATYIDPRK